VKAKLLRLIEVILLSVSAGHKMVDPEIDRVDLWRSTRGKYRSTRSTWPTLCLILCICLGF